MNPVLDSEIPSADMGEAGAAELSASGKRACDVAAMASARILVEDFGPLIFATTSSSCSTEAMNARMVDTSSACRNFSSPCDVQQTFSFAGRSTSPRPGFFGLYIPAGEFLVLEGSSIIRTIILG